MRICMNLTKILKCKNAQHQRLERSNEILLLLKFIVVTKI